MHFRILGEITDVETMATGSGIREIARLRKRYGRARWRKRKGIAEIEPPGMRSSPRRYTGTMRRESDVASSRSSASYEVMYDG
jgi:hypothetical protein